jgi:Domain of unknown function (DUF1840)
MLIPFRSKAAGEFFMLDSHAQALFALMGKPYAPKGIIAADELPLRLTQLQAALKMASPAPQAQDDTVDTVAAVGMKQRAWPLLDMMSRANLKKVDITWGIDV